MSETLDRVRACALRGEVRLSDYAVEELAKDSISVDDIHGGVSGAVLIEDYSIAARGPTVLALHHDREGKPLHVVWGFAGASAMPAVIVTASRPDPRRWSADLRERRR